MSQGGTIYKYRVPLTQNLVYNALSRQISLIQGYSQVIVFLKKNLLNQKYFFLTIKEN